MGEALTFGHEPPASGSHYPVWARYSAYTTTLPEGYWVHNLEHGAVVLLHRDPTHPELRAHYDAMAADPACGSHRRALLMPYPALPSPIAVVAANKVLFAECIDAPAIDAFVEANRGKGPENVCADGSYP